MPIFWLVMALLGLAWVRLPLWACVVAAASIYLFTAWYDRLYSNKRVTRTRSIDE